MCGFVAIFRSGASVQNSCAKRALETIAHRGPDASGEWQEEGIFLGHRRLSIIDLATGDQPMQSSDGRYVIVFNGEVYNFMELRELLTKKGASFRTRSDTEVILEGYRSWGARVVERLHGIFAFVIWDRQLRIAFAARDRVGIKPLCWAMDKDSLIISSTLEPFRFLGDFGRLDFSAVRDLMALDYIPTPRSIFKDVQKLDPGTTLEWSLGSPQPNTNRYWIPPLEDVASSPPDEYELEDLLARVVKRQMISDVPIGVFLSGGIDSSLIVAMMARHATVPVRTFSVAFSDVEADESGIAALVAQRFGARHAVLRAEEIGSDALLDLLGRLDEPFCDPALVPTYALSKMTSCQVKVALSGDGGDEVFGGYPKYLLPIKSHKSLPLSAAFHRTLEALPWRPRGVSHVYWRTLSSDDRFRFSRVSYGDFPVFRKDMRQLLTPAYQDAADIDAYFESWERRAQRYGNRITADVVMRTDIETYLSENCLVKTDRASMLASLEVRVPFLDELLLERILPLRTDVKIQDGQLKALLLPLARRLLPREVWDRPKHGFNVPLHRRMATSWRAAVEAMLSWGESNFHLFDYRYLRHLHNLNLSEGGIESELWNPFVLLAWANAQSVRI